MIFKEIERDIEIGKKMVDEGKRLLGGAYKLEE